MLFFYYLHSANLFILKAKRQLQKTTASIGDEMNAVLFPVQRVFKRLHDLHRAGPSLRRMSQIF